MSYGRECSMKIKHHVNRLNIFVKKNHKILIVVSITFALIAILLFSFLSFKNWDNYQKDYNQFFTSNQDSLDSKIDKIIKNADDSVSEKLDKIISLSNQLTDKNNTICETGDVYDWQKIIGSVNNEIESCKTKQENFNNQLEILKTTTNYLENEHKLSSIISIANSQTSKNNSPEKWHLIEAIWRKAISDIEKLEAYKEFDAIKKLSLDYLDKIADAWKSLNQANRDEDRQKFEKAKEDLAIAYSNLPKLTKSNERILKELGQ